MIDLAMHRLAVAVCLAEYQLIAVPWLRGAKPAWTQRTPVHAYHRRNINGTGDGCGEPQLYHNHTGGGGDTLNSDYGNEHDDPLEGGNGDPMLDGYDGDVENAAYTAQDWRPDGG